MNFNKKCIYNVTKEVNIDYMILSYNCYVVLRIIIINIFSFEGTFMIILKKFSIIFIKQLNNKRRIIIFLKKKKKFLL
jgi:hypothetical protein